MPETVSHDGGLKYIGNLEVSFFNKELVLTCNLQVHRLLDCATPHIAAIQQVKHDLSNPKLFYALVKVIQRKKQTPLFALSIEIGSAIFT